MWRDAGAAEDFPIGEARSVVVDGRLLAIYHTNDGYYATDGLCTHGLARLADGYLEDGEIECPLHQGRFDIATGKALCAPLTQDVRTYPLKVEGSRVFVDFS